MRVRKIKVATSYQMISQETGKEYWNKYSLSASIDELDDAGKKLVELRGFIHQAHTENNQDITVFTQYDLPKVGGRTGVRLEPDKSVRKAYAEAASREDHETIKKLEKVYDFQIY